MQRKLELLPPETYSEQLENRLSQLNVAILELKQQLKKAPAAHLRIVKRKHSVQYYKITKTGDSLGTYLPKKQIAEARLIVQSEYNRRVLKTLELEKTKIRTLLKHLSKKAQTSFYAALSPNRKSLVEPVTLTDQAYADRWQSFSYPKKEVVSNTEYFTAKGERVRSKSEILIADALFRAGVPYHYEIPVSLKTKKSTNITLHPDFFCLNKRTRKEYFWEHFGMLSNSEYLEQTAEKISLYSQNNIVPGTNLLFTLETDAQPITSKAIDDIIRNYLT